MIVKVDITTCPLSPEQKPHVLCSFYFDGTTVVCTNELFLKLARAMGAIGADGKTYFPADGMAFMNALPVLYKGPHLRATQPVEM